MGSCTAASLRNMEVPPFLLLALSGDDSQAQKIFLTPFGPNARIHLRAGPANASPAVRWNALLGRPQGLPDLLLKLFCFLFSSTCASVVANTPNRDAGVRKTELEQVIDLLSECDN